MKKIVCDRCGAFVDCVNVVKRTVLVCRSFKLFGDYFELCDDCYKKLKRFLKNKPEEEGDEND